MYDHVNAFLSTSKTQASDTACDLFQCSCFSISCPDGVITFMPGSGVLPASLFIVHVWVHIFRMPMVRVRVLDRQWNPHRDLLVVKVACGGPLVDLSLFVCAGETMNMYVASQATPAKLALYMQKSKQTSDTCLKPYTLSQNAKKRIIVPYIAGSRTRAFVHLLLHHPCTPKLCQLHGQV